MFAGWELLLIANLSAFEEALPFLTLLAGAFLTALGFLAKRLLDTYGSADVELERHLERIEAKVDVIAGRIEAKVDENTRALAALGASAALTQQRVAGIESVMGLPTNRMDQTVGTHRRDQDDEWERWTHHRNDDPLKQEPPR